MIRNECLDHVARGNMTVSVGKDNMAGLELYTYSREYQYGNFATHWDEFIENTRGIVFDVQTMDEPRVVALGLIKLFNYGEGDIHYPSPDATIVGCVEKVDGCCDQDTIIETEHGPKTIKEIVDAKYVGRVLSFNVDTNKQEMKFVVGHSVQRNNHDWYEIELIDGTVVKLTGNHRVWIPALGAYRRVEDLDGTEEFLLKD